MKSIFVFFYFFLWLSTSHAQVYKPKIQEFAITAISTSSKYQDICYRIEYHFKGIADDESRIYNSDIQLIRVEEDTLGFYHRTLNYTDSLIEMYNGELILFFKLSIEEAFIVDPKKFGYWPIYGSMRSIFLLHEYYSLLNSLGRGEENYLKDILMDTIHYTNAH